jgi:hypothetical protein
MADEDFQTPDSMQGVAPDRFLLNDDDEFPIPHDDTQAPGFPPFSQAMPPPDLYIPRPIPTDPQPSAIGGMPFFQDIYATGPPWARPPGLPLGPPQGGMPPPLYDIGKWGAAGIAGWAAGIIGGFSTKPGQSSTWYGIEPGTLGLPPTPSPPTPLTSSPAPPPGFLDSIVGD